MREERENRERWAHRVRVRMCLFGALVVLLLMVPAMGWI